MGIAERYKMINKSFFVVTLGRDAKESAHIEAEICKDRKAKIRILTNDRTPQEIFEWTVTESEVESLQNLFIFLRNELGISRLNQKLENSLSQDVSDVDGNEQSQIL